MTVSLTYDCQWIFVGHPAYRARWEDKEDTAKRFSLSTKGVASMHEMGRNSRKGVSQRNFCAASLISCTVSQIMICIKKVKEHLKKYILFRNNKHLLYPTAV